MNKIMMDLFISMLGCDITAFIILKSSQITMDLLVQMIYETTIALIILIPLATDPINQTRLQSPAIMMQ